MLKRHDPQEIRITKDDLGGLSELQLFIQAENWKGLACGSWRDEKIYAKDREAIIEYAKSLRSIMTDGGSCVALVGNERHLSRGRIFLRLIRGSAVLGPDETLLEH